MSLSQTLRTALIAVALLVAAPSARAQSGTAAALALFDEGRAALQRGELDVACAKFKESDHLDPAIGTEFNLANCEEQRGRLATAWVLFRQVFARMKTDDPRRGVAQQRVVALEARIPHVIFVADEQTPTDTRVKVDDLVLDAASFGSSIPLDPGEHRAIVRSSRASARTMVFTLVAGETTTLPLSPPRPDTAPRGEDAPRRPADDRILGMKRADATLLAGSIGVVGLLVGITTGVIGLDAEATGNGGCSSATKTCTQEGYDANQTAKSMAVVSTLGFVLGIAGGGAVTYLYMTTPTTDNSRQATTLGVGGQW